VDQVAAE